MARSPSKILSAPELKERKKALKTELATASGSEKDHQKKLAAAAKARDEVVKSAKKAHDAAVKEAEKTYLDAAKEMNKAIGAAQKSAGKVKSELEAVEKALAPEPAAA